MLWMGKSAVGLALIASWRLPSQADPRMAGLEVSPSQAIPAASWGQGHRVARQCLPCQACRMSAQDSVTHLLAKPSSETGQAQTRHLWPEVWTCLSGKDHLLSLVRTDS